MFKKIIKKDRNEELERILDEKQIDEQAKNLLQGILYKIEVCEWKSCKKITPLTNFYLNILHNKKDLWNMFILIKF